MKVIHSSLFRAVCAIIVGGLLIQYREQTVTWEMRQLGIMDWITNDVDWMTKEVHTSSVRLAWHN